MFVYPVARMRAQSNGDSLTDEWQKNAAYKAQKKAEDGARNARIQQVPFNLWVFHLHIYLRTTYHTCVWCNYVMRPCVVFGVILTNGYWPSRVAWWTVSGDSLS